MWHSLLPELSTVLILPSHASTRHWAGIQKPSFAVHAVVYNHGNPVRQCSMAAKDWLKKLEILRFFPSQIMPEAKCVSLPDTFSSLWITFPDRGNQTHFLTGIKGAASGFSFSICQISFKFRDYTLWTTAKQQGKNLPSNPSGVSSFESVVALAGTAWQTYTELGKDWTMLGCLLFQCWWKQPLSWSDLHFQKANKSNISMQRLLSLSSSNSATLLWNAIHWSLVNSREIQCPVNASSLHHTTIKCHKYVGDTEAYRRNALPTLGVSCKPGTR